MGKLNFHRSNLNETGMISITVTIVFIMVISMTVLGFSQVTRRTSREALDRQLGSQAYYAAESGINDVMNKIATYIQTGKEVPAQTDCKNETTSGYTKNGGKVETDDGAEVKYTCLLVNPNPDTLHYSNVGEGSVVIPLNATLPEQTLDSYTLKWQRASEAPSTANISKCPDLVQNKPADVWVKDCPFGLLRVDLMQIDTDSLASPEGAANATMTLFIYPKSGSTDVLIPYERSTAPNVYGLGAPQGQVKTAKCNQDECSVELTQLNFPNAYMRVRSLYVPTSDFAVELGSGTFSRSQVVIDVTGKAQDVLRRMQASLSMVSGSSRSDVNAFSDYALQTTNSICKRFSTAPNFAEEDKDFPCPD